MREVPNAAQAIVDPDTWQNAAGEPTRHYGPAATWRPVLRADEPGKSGPGRIPTA
jgi:hypothetical protein